jgi:hypothetical protein
MTLMHYRRTIVLKVQKIAQVRPPVRSTDPVSVGFVPPILNVTPLHAYFFTGEETGSADRAGGLTCGKLEKIQKPRKEKTTKKQNKNEKRQ